MNDHCSLDTFIDIYSSRYQLYSTLDFTRLKLVQSKKEVAEKEAQVKATALKKEELLAKANMINDEDITAKFDAQDDEDVVF